MAAPSSFHRSTSRERAAETVPRLSASRRLSHLALVEESGREWQEQLGFAEPPLNLEGAADHWNHREDTNNYSQPGALFRLMTPAQQQVLFENTARSAGGAPKQIQMRHIRNCLKADSAYGKGVANALAIALSEVPV